MSSMPPSLVVPYKRHCPLQWKSHQASQGPQDAVCDFLKGKMIFLFLRASHKKSYSDHARKRDVLVRDHLVLQRPRQGKAHLTGLTEIVLSYIYFLCVIITDDPN